MNKLAVIVLLVGLAACSKKKTEEGREPVQAAPSSGVGSAAPVAPVAPASATGNAATGNAATDNAATGGAATGGAATGGTATGGTTTGGMATGRTASVGCATAATVACDAGQSDGCAGGLTSVHVCVTKDAKAGAPCAQQPALACPAGQVDACLYNPPQATNHVCVVVPKPTP